MDLKKLLFGGKSAAERTAQYAHSTQAEYAAITTSRADLERQMQENSERSN